jgi:hypothetical protein
VDDPWHKRVHVDKGQAANQPIEQSTLQIRQDAPQPNEIQSQDARTRTQSV